MKIATLLASLAVLSTAVSLAPGAAAEKNPFECKDTDPDAYHDVSCDFSCRVNDTVSATIRGEGDGWNSAECHDASAGCHDIDYCTNTGTDVATSSGDDGDCSGNMVSGSLLCTAQAGPNSFGPLLMGLLVAQPPSCEAFMKAKLKLPGLTSFSFKTFEGGEVSGWMSWKAGTLTSPAKCKDSV